MRAAAYLAASSLTTCSGRGQAQVVDPPTHHLRWGGAVGDLMACVASAGRRARPVTCCACLRSFCWGCSMRSEVRRQKARLRACCVRCFALWCVPSLLQVSWRGGDTCPFVFVLFPCRQMLLLKSFPVVSLSYRCRQRLSLFLFLGVSSAGAELWSSLRRTNRI